MARQVEEIMARDLVAIDPSQSCVVAAQQMRDNDTGAIVVTGEGGALYGIVTDRDIVVRAVADARNPVDVRVDEVCTEDPTALSPSDSLERAADVMRERDVRRLPVVQNGKVVGMVSIGDLAIELDEHSALADISAARRNN